MRKKIELSYVQTFDEAVLDRVIMQRSVAQLPLHSNLAEYTKPNGAANLTLKNMLSLPEGLKTNLLSVEEIEAELGGVR